MIVSLRAALLFFAEWEPYKQRDGDVGFRKRVGGKFQYRDTKPGEKVKEKRKVATKGKQQSIREKLKERIASIQGRADVAKQAARGKAVSKLDRLREALKKRRISKKGPSVRKKTEEKVRIGAPVTASSIKETIKTTDSVFGLGVPARDALVSARNNPARRRQIYTDTVRKVNERIRASKGGSPEAQAAIRMAGATTIMGMQTTRQGRLVSDLGVKAVSISSTVKGSLERIYKAQPSRSKNAIVSDVARMLDLGKLPQRTTEEKTKRIISALENIAR